MPQPIAVKIGKVDVPSSDVKSVAEKTALTAAKKAAGGTKFDKKYEVTLSVKVEFDKKDKPTEVKASNTFVIAEDGKLVPRLAVTKSGVASAKGFGSKVADGVTRRSTPSSARRSRSSSRCSRSSKRWRRRASEPRSAGARCGRPSRPAGPRCPAPIRRRVTAARGPAARNGPRGIVPAAVARVRPVRGNSAAGSLRAAADRTIVGGRCTPCP